MVVFGVYVCAVFEQHLRGRSRIIPRRPVQGRPALIVFGVYVRPVI